ncbi:MAG: PAS domain-containing protein [Phycisphaerae bacterium]|nr:PAS domain-containing protein [Phycisphaerae bacterium]
MGSSSDQTSYEHASNEHTSGERLLAMMHDGIAIVDHTGRLEWANEPFALLIGNSLKELKNRPLMTYICPESRSTFEKFLLPHLNPGKLSDVQEAKECEISLCGRTGQDIWFLAMASPLLQSPSSPSSSFQNPLAKGVRILER